MMKNGVNNIQAVSLRSFPADEVHQAFYKRHGGVSPTPWASLNHGGMLGDDPENVVENRKRMLDHFGRPVESVYDVWQVHSSDIVSTNFPRPLHTPHVKADAILTNRPEITLMMRFADCVPLIFYDPEQRVIGIAHAGWKGTVQKIAQLVIGRMKEKYGSTPRNILAGIGPAIGPGCYEIGSDVLKMVLQAFGKQADDVLRTRQGKHYFNLWRANQITLIEAGVQAIEVLEICTACHRDDWYSHRAEQGKTGRFAALISLI